MPTAILALDQGTTSSRAIVFDAAGVIHAAAQQEFRQIYPQTGWVEHDPEEIWQTQLATARDALARAGVKPCDLAGIGITNQRETTVVWDRKTGAPVHNAIVWQDRRTAGFCDDLKRAGHAELIQRKAGLVIDAYFSGSKLRWILDHVPGARERAGRGELAFGTIDTWLLWKLTGGRLHAGDQQAALFGQNCFSRGFAKNTYGTGCFMLMNIGPEPVPSKNQLITTVAWQINGQTDFALEGSVFIGGAVVQWLRDGLGLIKSSSEIEKLAASVPDCGGVYLVPAFAGLGAPHWDQYARGTMTGITRGTTAAHVARAALEGIAFQVADILDVMRQDSGVAMHELRVDGGACANNLLMQFQADILQVPVVRPTVIETTALGAAYLAGLATGVWKNRDELRRAWRVDRTFEPQMSAEQATYRRNRWAEALRRAKDWEEVQN